MWNIRSVFFPRTFYNNSIGSKEQSRLIWRESVEFLIFLNFWKLLQVSAFLTSMYFRILSIQEPWYLKLLAASKMFGHFLSRYWWIILDCMPRLSFSWHLPALTSLLIHDVHLLAAPGSCEYLSIVKLCHQQIQDRRWILLGGACSFAFLVQTQNLISYLSLLEACQNLIQLQKGIDQKCHLATVPCPHSAGGAKKLSMLAKRGGLAIFEILGGSA